MTSKIKNILTALQEIGYVGKYEPSENWQTTDDSIIITEKLHIQIGRYYMNIVQEINEDFYFGKNCRTISELIEDIKIKI